MDLPVMDETAGIWRIELDAAEDGRAPLSAETSLCFGNGSFGYLATRPDALATLRWGVGGPALPPVFLMLSPSRTRHAA